MLTTLSRTIRTAIQSRYRSFQHQLESALRPERRRRSAAAACGSARAVSRRLTTSVIDERHHQHARAEEHQRVGRVVEAPNERRDRRGADPRAQRLADADERKQPAPLTFGVEVVRERPELRHDEHVDEADPDVEGDAFPQSEPARRDRSRRA